MKTRDELTVMEQVSSISVFNVCTRDTPTLFCGFVILIIDTIKSLDVIDKCNLPTVFLPLKILMITYNVLLIKDWPVDDYLILSYMPPFDVENTLPNMQFLKFFSIYK